MATTKKASKAPTKRAAVAKQPEVVKESKPEAKPETAEPRAEAPKPEPEPFSFTATLVEGASYSLKRHSFVAGRPVTSTDRGLYDLLKNNGRFKVFVKGGK